MGRKSVNAVRARVMSGRGSISFRELEAFLLRIGFKLVRTKGSHRIYAHPKATRPLNIQPKGNDAKRYQVNQLRDMIVEFNLLDD